MQASCNSHLKYLFNRIWPIGACGIISADRRELIIPGKWQPGVEEQTAGGQSWGMTPFENVSYDLRGEERQP